MNLRALFSRRWWWVTLLVIAGMALLVRLGFWQLDRLQQRRDYNALVAARWKEDPFPLDAGSLPADLSELEFRRVEVAGRYDYDHQIVLKNQFRGDQPGSMLVTPLVMADGRAVLVARGWVPQEEAVPERWGAFNEPSDRPIVGLVQESQRLPGGRPLPTPAAPQTDWFYLDLAAIAPQMPHELLPVFVLQLPEEGRAFSALPYREIPIALDEGSHLSYAIQWFMFAVILGFGYSQYVRYQERREERIRAAIAAGGLPDGEDGDLPTRLPTPH